MTVRSAAALRHPAWAPSELGFARAYVTGELDVSDDLEDGLRRVVASYAAPIPPVSSPR